MESVLRVGMLYQNLALAILSKILSVELNLKNFKDCGIYEEEKEREDL